MDRYFNRDAPGRTGLERSAPAVARNAPCPCGSGKKYKRCCTRHPPDDVPPELVPFVELDDPEVGDLIQFAQQNRNVLGDAEFWWELGIQVGSRGHHDLALAANRRAVELEPSHDGYKLNLAVTHGLLGRLPEALELLDTVSDDQPRRAVIRANLLQDLGRHEDAIAQYEKAVTEEPDFYLPWARLLVSLRATHNPTFEYWLRRAITAVPDSPVVAKEYCYFLLRTHRLEELVDADWIERLESSVGRVDIVGRDEDTPQLIVEAQLFRSIGMVSAMRSIDELQKAVSVLTAAPRAWHLCDSARLLAASAANLGEALLVRQSYDRICQHCRNEEGLVTTFVARAFRVAGAFTDALREADASLQVNPDDRVALWEKWWCLNECDRLDEAIETATYLHGLSPGYPDLARSLGWLHQKRGTLGHARQFYEAAVADSEAEHLARENLAFVLLLEGELEAGDGCFAAYLDLVRRLLPEGLPDRSDASAGEHVVVIAGTWSADLEAERAKWGELLAHAVGTVGSPSFAFDLLRMNERSEPVLASKTTLRTSEYSIDRVIDAVMNPGSEVELAHQLRMLQRGDFSGLWAEFAEQVSVWEKLPHEAKLALIEPQRRLTAGGAADHAPDVMSFAKAVEIALRCLVFDPYAEVARRDPALETHVEAGLSDKFRKAHGFVRFVQRGQHLELGSMLFSLRLCRGKTGRKLALLGRLRDFVEEDLRSPALLSDESFDDLEALAGLRNPAAHSTAYGQAEARRARAVTLRQLERFGHV
jgi:tetratricopeptide (TPR) repeat protein